MGPSGAGKSTLLYALMGTAKYGATTGRVWVNNRAIPLQRLRRIVGYVPQVLLLQLQQHMHVKLSCQKVKQQCVMHSSWHGPPGPQLESRTVRSSAQAGTG